MLRKRFRETTARLVSGGQSERREMSRSLPSLASPKRSRSSRGQAASAVRSPLDKDMQPEMSSQAAHTPGITRVSFLHLPFISIFFLTVSPPPGLVVETSGPEVAL